MGIMEVDLTMDLREWYMKAVKQFGWSKTALIAYIAANAHESIVFSVEDEACYIMEQKKAGNFPNESTCCCQECRTPDFWTNPKVVADLERRWATIAHYVKKTGL